MLLLSEYENGQEKCKQTQFFSKTKKVGHYHKREPFRPLLKRNFKITKGQILIYFQWDGIKTWNFHYKSMSICLAFILG